MKLLGTKKWTDNNQDFIDKDKIDKLEVENEELFDENTYCIRMPVENRSLIIV